MAKKTKKQIREENEKRVKNAPQVMLCNAVARTLDEKEHVRFFRPTWKARIKYHPHMVDWSEEDGRIFYSSFEVHYDPDGRDFHVVVDGSIQPRFAVIYGKLMIDNHRRLVEIMDTEIQHQTMMSEGISVES